jgi:hypothetical protein
MRENQEVPGHQENAMTTERLEDILPPADAALIAAAQGDPE